MKTSLLVPVLNEEKNLPSLFKALASWKEEILFIDNGSTDQSLSLLKEFTSRHGNARLLQESRRGFAEPLNLALGESTGDLLLFLDADAVPAPGWRQAMVKGAQSADILVGETLSTLQGQPTPYGKLALKLFHRHSRRTATAQGHALPWGPTCNLGVKRSWFETVGPFSPEAAGAFDIDWCWRAVLAGARLAFLPKAVVRHQRRNSREELLRQFDRYGLGEAWLHRSYSFLLDAEDRGEDPLLAGVAAYRRLRHGSEASRLKSLQNALEEVAAAFGSGVRSGFERPHRQCPMERRALQTVSWESRAGEETVFVPGKGLTSLRGKPLQLWEAYRKGASQKDLEKVFGKLFRAEPEEARHALEDFLEGLKPAAGGWVKVPE